MAQKIFEIGLVSILILLTVIVVTTERPSENKVYTKFLNLSNQNKEIYVNEKKVENVDEIFNGLKHTKEDYVGSMRSTKGGCVNIKILSKKAGMSLCISDSNYDYFVVTFQRFYLKDSGWQPLYIGLGTLKKRYLQPYIKEALLQSKTDFTYNDYHGDETDKEILLKHTKCEQKKENGWKLNEGDSNITKEVCEIILDYTR